MDPSREKIERAVSGDKDALSDLLVQHGSTVAKAINADIDKKWRSVLDVDDVMQVTFIEAFLHVGGLTATNGDGFVRWLRRIARNNLCDAVRGLQCEKRPQPSNRVQHVVGSDSYVGLLDRLGGSTNTPSHHAAHHEVQGCIDRALHQLPEDYRMVVQLYDLEGRSGPEVAARLGKSRSTVHMLRARALDRLREIIGRESEFFSGVVRR